MGSDSKCCAASSSSHERATHRHNLLPAARPAHRRQAGMRRQALGRQGLLLGAHRSAVGGVFGEPSRLLMGVLRALAGSYVGSQQAWLAVNRWEHPASAGCMLATTLPGVQPWPPGCSVLRCERRHGHRPVSSTVIGFMLCMLALHGAQRRMRQHRSPCLAQQPQWLTRAVHSTFSPSGMKSSAQCKSSSSSPPLMRCAPQLSFHKCQSRAC